MKILYKLLTLILFSLFIFVWGGSSVSALSDYGWAKTWGDPADESYASGTVADSAGNVYVVGYYYGANVDFDTGVGTNLHSSVGSSDIYLSKFDRNGNFIWARTWGSTQADQANAVALDSSGNVYVTGKFAGVASENVDFDGTSGTDIHVAYGNNANLFITKYSPNGSYLWSQTLSGAGNNSGLGIAVATDGGVYVTGFISGTVDMDPTATVENYTVIPSRMYVSKYDTNGSYHWTKVHQGTGSSEGDAITVDTLGNVYVGGYYANTVDFDPTAGVDQYTYATTGGFITKYDSDGNYLWVKLQIGAGSGHVATTYGIRADSNNNIYSTGRMSGTIDFDPGVGTVNHTSNGGEDIFLQKLNSNGDYVWSKNIGGTTNERGYGVAIDPEDNVYIGGYWSGTVDFDPGVGDDTKTVTSDWGVSKYASAYDLNGNYLWTKITNAGFESDGNAITAYGLGVYLVGVSYGDVDYDPEGTSDILSSSDWGSSSIVKWITDNDIIEPTITIDSLTGNATNDNTPVVTGTAVDSQTVITDVEYSINGAIYENCAADDSVFDELSEDFTCSITNALNDGTHSVEVRATDSNSNTTSGANIPEYNFTVDTTAPVITVDEFSNDNTTDKTPLITGNATDALTPINIVQISINGGTFQNCTAADGTFDELNENFNCQIPSSLTLGTHSVEIRAIDGTSNINSGGTLGTYTFSVVKPTVPQDNPQTNNIGTTTDDESDIDEEEPIIEEEEPIIDQPIFPSENPITTPPVDTPKGDKFFDSAARWIIDLVESINSSIKEIAQEGNIIDIISSVKTANFVQEAGILTGLMTASFVYPFGFTQAFPIFSNGILNILGIFGFKKRGKPFGYVYNQRTKAPISLAVIRIFDEAGSLITTSVTNAYGVFKAELIDGRYRIEVAKTGFNFPSELTVGNTDGVISNVYTGGYINLTNDKLENISIPLDLEEEYISIWHKIGRKLSGFFNLLIILAFALGLVYSVYVLVMSPSVYNWLVIIAYLISLGIYGGVLKDSLSVGRVKVDGKDIEGVKISLRRMDFDKVVDSRFTDDKGNYKFIVTPGEYEIFVDDNRFKEVGYEKFVFEVVNKTEVIYRNIKIEEV